MAIEYFDEKIVPGLMPKLNSLSPLRLLRYPEGLGSPSTPLRSLTVRQPSSEPSDR